MQIHRRATAIIGLVLVVGACAQQEEPEPITVLPTIDKLGNATCPAGLVLAVEGSTGNQVCAEPAAL